MPKKTKAIKKTDQKKPWLKKVKPSLYQIETKDPQKTILIVTEGQTEKLYFESFPVLTLTVKVVDLKGVSKLQLIKATQNIIEYEDAHYDEVWCVFDMDKDVSDRELAHFDNAIKKGRSKGFHIAYSNDCFELWFYLHYQYNEQQNSRTFYYKYLSKKWNCNYEKQGKNYRFCSHIYDRLQNDKDSSQQKALKRAAKLYTKNQNKPFHDQNPVTTVYKLVNSLNKNLKR